MPLVHFISFMKDIVIKIYSVKISATSLSQVQMINQKPAIQTLPDNLSKAFMNTAMPP